MKIPLKVLIIEDSESDADLTVRYLEKADFEVVHQRIETLEDIPDYLLKEDWDLVISDYQLPGFTGADALGAYLQAKRDIPFILISGTVGEETAVGLMKMGAHDYLLKDNIIKLPAVVKREMAEAANRRARRKAEQEIQSANESVRESEARFRAIYDNMFQFIGLLSPEGILLEANQTALDLAGMPLESVDNKPFWEGPWWRHSAEAREQLVSSIQLAAQGAFIRYETEILDHAGNSITLDFSIRPIRNDQGEVVLLIPEGRDISEAKKAKQELSSAFDLMSAQNKRLMNFSYIISHNLRSHSSRIAAILSYIEDTDSEEEKSEMLHHLRTVADSLDETMHNLNEVVSIQTNVVLQPESINLHEAVGKVMKVFEDDYAAKHAHLQNLIPVDTFVQHNPAYLESILMNFLSNAIRYSHPSRIPDIRLSCSEKPPFTCLHIADNGIGIDLEKNGEKLFGMYKTFSETPGSKGLGLFITKNQVEALGGKIEVQSELGVGSTFTIFFKK